jgi:sucrose-6-phosphate hydrolase SacC (GH32 family)
VSTRASDAARPWLRWIADAPWVIAGLAALGLLLYTAAGNPTTQCLAWSRDGRTFTKYEGNPILKEITPGNRDPKVIWHAPTSRWEMTLNVEVDKLHVIHFFRSKDLKERTNLSSTEGVYECPDFFELPVEGQPGRSRWVLTGASSEYMVGEFDGTTFRPETPKLPGHRGRGFYAAQTFSDIPANDGRRIQIGWFQTATTGMPFNQSMTVPLELRLRETTAGPRMTWSPARELASLREQSRRLNPFTLAAGGPRELFSGRGKLLDIDADFEPGQATSVTFTVRGQTFDWEGKTA